jgi:predicted dehydrogenase
LRVPCAYRTYEEVLADPHILAVHIATPNRFHFSMAQQALEAGKHVMCEKPLAMRASESARLVAVAARCPQQCAGVNYNIRYYPLCLEAAHRVRTGQLGTILHVSGSYVQDWLLWPTDYNWRVLADQGGSSRAVADIGTHWFDLIHSITGLDVESVCADLRTVHPVRQRPPGEVTTFGVPGGGTAGLQPVDIDTEDYGAILLRFRGGARGAVVVSQVTAGRKNCLRFEMAGSAAALAFDSERPNALWIGHRDRPNESLIRDPALLSDLARSAASYPGGHNEGYPDSFKQCFQQFYDRIRANDYSNAPKYPTFEDGHREIVLCEAVLRSVQQNGWVDVQGAIP